MLKIFIIFIEFVNHLHVQNCFVACFKSIAFQYTLYIIEQADLTITLVYLHTKQLLSPIYNCFGGYFDCPDVVRQINPLVMKPILCQITS